MHKTIIRKSALLIIIACLSAVSVSARTWTLRNGEKVEGDFHRIEGKWIVVLTDSGDKRPINLAHLGKKDRAYARNLAAILGNKPPEIEATDPAKRVPTGETKPTPPKKRKPSVTLTLAPEEELLPEPEMPKPVETPVVEPDPAPENTAEPVAEKVEIKVVESKSPTETQMIIAHKSESTLDSLKSQTDRVSKTVKKSNLVVLANALDRSLKKNKNITIYFLILFLLIVIHKMHMPQLYKTKFKPKKSEVRPTINKQFKKDDDRERFRECPFCRLTNPTSAEKCEHCGQFIK